MILLRPKQRYITNHVAVQMTAKATTIAFEKDRHFQDLTPLDVPYKISSSGDWTSDTALKYTWDIRDI